MKNTLENFLILGGIYHLISFFPLAMQEEHGNIAAWILLGIFFIFCILLLTSVGKKLFSIFHNKYKRLKNYLSALGAEEYKCFLLKFIPGIIYGSIYSKAEYNGTEPPVIPEFYLYFVQYGYFIMLGLALIIATYVSFIKKPKESSEKK